jgi:hypothetical protein
MRVTQTIRERIITIRILTTTRPLSKQCQAIRTPWFKPFTPEALWEVDLHLKIIQAPSDSIISRPILTRDRIRKSLFHPRMAGLDTE